MNVASLRGWVPDAFSLVPAGPRRAMDGDVPDAPYGRPMDDLRSPTARPQVPWKNLRFSHRHLDNPMGVAHTAHSPEHYYLEK